MSSLERKTLSVRLADEIERSIRSGEWTDLFPGYRALMKTYAVAAKTSIAAIRHLQDRGIISAGEAGKRRKILIEGAPATRKLETLLIIDAMTAPSGGHAALLQSYSRVWIESGGRVVNLRFDFPRYRRPARLLRETVERYGADAILLQVPTKEWVKAAVALRPTFLDGGMGILPESTAVSHSMGAETKRVAEMLYKLGHRRIAVPLELISPGFEKAVRNKLADALNLGPLSREVEQLCPVFPESIPAAWNGYWKKLFSSVGPTAVILNKDLYVHSLYCFCARHNISIPRDLSIVCLESTESLRWCDPEPTRMLFPEEEAVKFFRKWVRGGCRPLGWKMIPLKSVKGGSVARPR